jgi:peptidoglycan hydrolase-like protein with peptidoglycan-binding domain
MAEIGASVGVGGTNREEDVREIQVLLDATPAGQGGPNPVLDIDGWCGQETIAAIRAYQQKQFGWQDGRVDPGKNTIGRLNLTASGPDARPVPLPDLDPAQLALQSIPLASKWANSGLAAIQQAVDAGGAIAGLDPILVAALGAHFKITPAMPPAEAASLLAIIRRNYSEALQTLARAQLVFTSVSRQRASTDRAPGAPGYTRFKEAIRWSPVFHTWVGNPPNRPGLDWTGHGWGPKCRAAMVLHEPIHNVDILGNFDVYEHGPEYLTMRPERAAHNASSYPSFAAHVDEKSNAPLGPRYGAGRPSD